MKTLVVDFNDAFSQDRTPLSSYGDAAREAVFTHEHGDYVLTVLRRDGDYRLAVREAQGKAVPDFSVTMLAKVLVPEPREESVDLGRASLFELASLRLDVRGKPAASVQIIPEVELRAAHEIECAREQREAWNLLFEERTAPPGMDTVGLDWKALTEALARKLPAPSRPDPAPGQVWSLSGDMDGPDEEGQYRRMPPVLLVSTAHGIRGALCCSQLDLAGELDVPLGEDLGFAESWNLVNLPFLVLRECLHTVDDEIVEEVRRLSSRFPPMPDTDWREAFDLFERETARLCEQRSLVLHLAFVKKPSLLNKAAGWLSDLGQALEKLIPEPDDRLVPALAADGARKVGVCVLGRDGRFEHHHHGEITAWRMEPGMAHVGGRLTLPPDMAPSILIVSLYARDHEPSHVVEHLDNGHSFSVRLPVPEGLEHVRMEHLRLLAVCY